MLQCLKHVAVPQTCLVLEVYLCCLMFVHTLPLLLDLKQNTSRPCHKLHLKDETCLRHCNMFVNQTRLVKTRLVPATHAPRVCPTGGVRGKRRLWSGLWSGQLRGGGIPRIASRWHTKDCTTFTVASHLHIAWCYATSTFAISTIAMPHQPLHHAQPPNR